MSDNIPFDLQIEIIKKVSDVKSLVRFRFICLIDDDNNTFKVQQQEFAPFVLSPLLKQYNVYDVVGACHGLLYLYGFHNGYKEWMLVIWNPSIGKSFGIAASIGFHNAYKEWMLVHGFGVCPVNKDPTIVKIKQRIGMPWHVEVFTLSSGVWNVIPSGNLPRNSIELNPTAQEFNLVELPDSLTKKLIYGFMSVSKLRESLVVYGTINVDGAFCCGVWVMEHDSSFRKLFSVGTPN
ncbi:hypothetical protein Tco_0049185 [Tanacetum coccineum]